MFSFRSTRLNKISNTPARNFEPKNQISRRNIISSRPQVNTGNTNKAPLMYILVVEPRNESPLFPGEKSIVGGPVKRLESAYLEKLPSGFKEDKELASFLTLDKFFRPARNSYDSFLTVHFIEKDIKKKTLEEFVQWKMKNHTTAFPKGSAAKISVSASITGHIKQPHAAILLLPRRIPESEEFESLISEFKNNLRDKTQDRDIGTMDFIVESPKGFWQFCWHNEVSTLVREKELIFVEMVKNVRLQYEGEGEMNLRSSSVKKTTPSAGASVLSNEESLLKHSTGTTSSTSSENQHQQTELV